MHSTIPTSDIILHNCCLVWERDSRWKHSMKSSQVQMVASLGTRSSALIMKGGMGLPCRMRGGGIASEAQRKQGKVGKKGVYMFFVYFFFSDDSAL